MNSGEADLQPRAYRLGDWTVRARSTEPYPLDWTDESLAPFIERVPAGLAGFEVEAMFGEQDPDPLPAGEPCDEPLFLGRVGTGHRSEGRYDLVDSKQGVHYSSTEDRVRVHYRRPTRFLEHEPARIIREALATQASSDGWCRMHAAAVAVDGGAILIVGAAGSGKSSTVVQLLARGASYIANDRLLVRAAPDGGVSVRGLPIAVRWSAAQLAQFAAGPDFISDYSTHSSLRRSDLKAGFRKYELALPEVAAVAGCTVTREARVVAVVMPRRQHDQPSELLQAGPEELAQELPAHFLPTDLAFPPFFLLRRPDERQTSVSISAATRALTRLPGYVLAGSHDDQAIADQLSDRLRAGSTPGV